MSDIFEGVNMDIHTYFGLSYANYLTIPRSVLQNMPTEWQWKFVKLLNELDATEWQDLLPENTCYKVELKKYDYEFVSVNEEDEEDDEIEYEIEEILVWKETVEDPLIDYDRGRRKVPLKFYKCDECGCIVDDSIVIHNRSFYKGIMGKVYYYKCPDCSCILWTDKKDSIKKCDCQESFLKKYLENNRSC